MSFLGGVDLSAAGRQALTRDLEFRRKDERLAARFSGYHYRGGVDLVLRHGEFRWGRTLPEQYEHLRGPMSLCFANALRACDADPSLRYCEGYMTSGMGEPIVHGWCIAPDGGVVELTLPAKRGEHAQAVLQRTMLPFMPPERWAYYGVIFDARLVHAHDEAHGLPMLDRGYAEIARPEGGVDMSEVHDFPVLTGAVRHQQNGVAMSTQEDIIEVVDEIADDVDPPRIEREAERLGITIDELLDRVVTEVKARIS